MSGAGVPGVVGDYHNYRLSGAIAVSTQYATNVALATEIGPFLSSDGGDTWFRAMDNGAYGAEGGVDFRSLRFSDGSDDLYVAGDRGVAVGRGTRARATFSWDWSVSRKLLTMQFGQRVASNLATTADRSCLPFYPPGGGIGTSAESGSLVAGGTQDNGVLITDAGTGTFWRQVCFGDGGFATFVSAPQPMLLFSVTGSGSIALNKEVICRPDLASQWGAVEVSDVSKANGSTSAAGMITRLPSRAPRRWRQARDAVPRSGY
jgi:hypothetical protein